MSDSKVIIVGAGLAGSLLAIYLAKRGFKVDIFEARGDQRNEEVAAGRSINLALSDRGIAALREVGMDEYMLAEAVPMYGRMIHSVSGETKLLPYSGRKGEYINSVSRAGLNIALINEAEKYSGVQFVFNERCVDFDSASGEVTFASGRTIRGDTVIATDGAGSAIRQALERQFTGIVSHSIFLEHGYKELHIPALDCRQPAGNERGRFAIEPNALHIWPRHQFMMIALPNFDGSFTCTLFLAHKSVAPASAGDQVQKPAREQGRNTQVRNNALPDGQAPSSAGDQVQKPAREQGRNTQVRNNALPDGQAPSSAGGQVQKPAREQGRDTQVRNNALPGGHASAVQLSAGGGGNNTSPAFDQLTDENSLLDFFNREFPDAVPLMPTLVDDFFHNPTGELGTVNCWPWNVEGRALLLGDSAHAMVPFYGQGMNCAFEDVRVLNSLLSEPSVSAGRQIDWKRTFQNYAELRRPNTDAIQQMAEENFYEMRDATADPVFQRKRALETKLEQTYPDYFSKYSMVTFREDLPYSVAKEIGNAQDRLLMDICSKETNINDIDLSFVLEQLRKL